MIEVRNISKAFGENEVLKNVSFDFEKGKTNLIIGSSGSGKTVLIKQQKPDFHPIAITPFH